MKETGAKLMSIVCVVDEQDLKRVIVFFNLVCLGCLLLRQGAYWLKGGKSIGDNPNQRDPLLLPLYATVLGVVALDWTARAIIFEGYYADPDAGLISTSCTTILKDPV